MTDKDDELLKGLQAQGCRVETADATTLVSLPDEFAEFVFERLGGWLYLGTTFMAPEEFEGSSHVDAFNRFLLELQDRNLGCHFSYDRANFLTIGAEIYPGEHQADDLLQIMEQIAFIIEVCIPLCDQVLENGDIPSDGEIDNAFGVSVKLH